MVDLGCNNLSVDEAMQTLQLVYSEINKVSDTLIGVRNNGELGFYCPKTGVLLSSRSTKASILGRNTYGVLSRTGGYYKDGYFVFTDAKIYLVECNKTLEFMGDVKIFEAPLTDYKYLIIKNNTNYSVVNAITGETVEEMGDCVVQKHFDLDNPTGIVVTITCAGCIYAITRDGGFDEVPNILSKFNPVITRKGKGKQYKFKTSSGEEVKVNELGQRY